ncbi:MAG: hypothetical protein R3D27_09655 [Hyphomicrobiaceae bacterium]
MALRIVQFAAVIAVALYLVPTGAHVFELPAKLSLAPADYMTVQRIYAGWALFGGVIFTALALVLAQAIMLRRSRTAFSLTVLALLALVTTQVIFWQATYPVNVATRNWTAMPEAFEAARRQWEFSHAASAALTFLALAALLGAVFATRSRPRD